MARFSDVDVFLAVASAGSFRRAAHRLEVTKSTVSRAVARLEVVHVHRAAEARAS